MSSVIKSPENHSLTPIEMVDRFILECDPEEQQYFNTELKIYSQELHERRSPARILTPERDLRLAKRVFFREFQNPLRLVSIK